MDARDDGLGLSVAIYAAAMLCGFAVVAVPVYLVNGPTVLQARSAQAGHAAIRTLVPRSSRQIFPVARLRHPTIVDPALRAALSARAKKIAGAHAQRIHPTRHADSRRRLQARPAYAEIRPQPRPAYPNISAIF